MDSIQDFWDKILDKKRKLQYEQQIKLESLKGN